MFSILKERAVVYGLLSRGWNSITALLTAPLIIIFLSPELQGFYYTFASLLGLQSLIVLGLGQVIQQFVSHEWANLSFENNKRISGNSTSLKRLAGILDFTLKWYTGFGLLISFGLGIGGYYFLSYSTGSDTSLFWIYPWFFLCFLQGIHVFISPSLVFLEGCNEVKEVNKFRLHQSVVSRFANWLVLIIGGKLWLFAAGVAVSILVQLRFIITKYSDFFRSILETNSSGSITWREEIFPIQWRYAINSIAGYVTMSVITPVIFTFKGAVTAGQIGMTWSIITMVWAFSYSLLNTKVPTLAIEYSKKNYKKMLSVFFNSLYVSLFILITALSLIVITIYFINYYSYSIAERFIQPLPTLILSIAFIFNHIRYAVVSYVRAMKLEPFWMISIAETIFASAVFIYFARDGSVVELITGYMLVIVIAAIFSFKIFYKYLRINMNWKG